MTGVIVERLPAWDVVSDVMLRLNDLVLSNGTLWASLLDAREKHIGDVYIAKVGDHIVGWALRRPTPAWEPEGDNDFKIFVDPDFRRQGIGKALLREAAKDGGVLVVYPHDPVSDYFLFGHAPEDSVFCEDWSCRGVDISDWRPSR